MLTSSNIHIIGASGFIPHALKNRKLFSNSTFWGTSSTSNYFDLFDPLSWDSFFSKSPTHVIFLSWPFLPQYYSTSHLLKTLPAAIAFFSQLYSYQIEKLICLGTCYEYGLLTGHLKESFTVNPLIPYAQAKYLLSQYLLMLYRDQPNVLSWLRVFYLYGEGQRKQSLLPSLMQHAKDGKRVFSVSTADRIRDFISISSLIDIIECLIQDPTSSGIYNCGSGIPQSIRTFAQNFIDKNNLDLILKEDSNLIRSDESYASWADISRLEKYELDLSQ